MIRATATLSLLLLAQACTSAAPKIEPLRIDAKGGRITFGARIARSNVYEELKGAIEYVLVMPGGKEYESLFIAPVDPLALHAGIRKLGLEPGSPATEDEEGKATPPTGPKVRLWVRQKGRERVPLERFVLDVKTGKSMEPVGWIFTGSREGYDPTKDAMVLQATITRNLVSLHHADATVLLQNPAGGDHYAANTSTRPPAGTVVLIILEAETATSSPCGG